MHKSKVASLMNTLITQNKTPSNMH